ncbi:MAG TPA: T9SS type A sorting domain-containing protein, partial [Bacteroidia bacterium]|nr:T9SS type A sorting domain-containing protein [Bacteroidia bacterium]
ANGAAGGVGCNIGSPSGSSDWAGGGGGFCGDGGIYNTGATKGGYSFLHGGWGGPVGATGGRCHGGYGGGSGCGDRGAGGGGYSGGSGATNNALGGGGGGSYNAGTAQSGAAGVQTGDGQVVITWTVPTGPVVTTLVLSNVTCNGGNNGSARALATGGTGKYTYSWAPSGGAKDTGINLTAGVYTVTVNDSCGNSTTATATVTQPSAISIVKGTITSWVGKCNGKAYVTVSGGTAPYTYLWTNGATTDTIKNLCDSNYCCTVTDMNGCVDSVCMNVVTSIQILNNASSIKIFPNPNNGMFTISGLSKGMEVEVYNYLGEKISDMKASDATMQFNISDKSTGAYLVRILTKDGTLVGQEKLIKQD